MTAQTASARFTSVSATAGQTVLAYDFVLTEEAALAVVRIRAGATAGLVLGDDYSFPAGLGTIAGGTLTLASAALDGDVYQLIGLLAETRQSDFLSTQAFKSDKFNADLDRLTRVAQEHRRDIDRAWKSGYGTEGGRIDTLTEGHFHKTDAAGNLVDAGSVADIAAAQDNAAAAAAAALAASSSAAAAAASAAGLNMPAIATGDKYSQLFVQGDESGQVRIVTAINPQLFGAVSDDTPSAGRIDSNTTAMQAMLDAGEPIAVNRGLFVASHMDLPADVHIQGAGPLSIIRKAGSDQHLFERADNSAASNLILRDLCFDGDINDFTAAGRNNADALVYFAPVSGLLDVRGCSFKDPRGRALYARSNGAKPYTRALVIGNSFTGGYECTLSATAGLTKSSVYVNVVDCGEAMIAFNFLDLGYDPVLYTGLSGITVTTFDVDNSREPIKATIIGNLIRRLGKGGNGAGSGSTGALEVYKGGGQLIIAQNRVSFATARAINIKADSGDSLISDNIVHSSYDVQALATLPAGTSVSNGPGIIVNGSVEQSGSVENGFRVIGNRVRNVKAEGIFVEGEGQSAAYGDQVIVANNQVEATVGAGIRINKWHKAMVHGNHVKGAGQNAISWSGIGELISLQGNIVDGAVNNALNCFGAGNGTYSAIIEGNSLSGCVDGINLDTVGRAKVSGNLIDNLSSDAINVLNAAGRHHISNNTLGPTLVQNYRIDSASRPYVWIQDDSCELLESASVGQNSLVPASGVAAAFRDWMYLSAGDSNLATLNGGRDGAELTIIYNGGQIANTGNIKLSASPTTLNGNDVITLVKRGSNWHEKCRSVNA